MYSPLPCHPNWVEMAFTVNELERFMKNYVILGISILSGLIAFLAAQKHFAQREKELALKGKKVKVLVARRRMIVGEPLKPLDFETKEYPVSLLTKRPEGGFDVIVQSKTDPEWKKVFMQGWSLAVNLDKGQPLRWKQLDIGNSLRGYAFQSKIKKTNRGLTLPVDSITSVANLIGPNDNVDIIATFRNFPLKQGSDQLVKASMILLQNVKVLAVGKKYRGTLSNKGKGGYSSITLSVTPKEAEMLVFANQEGKLHFVLRNDKDYKWTDDTKQVNFYGLQRSIDTYLQERKIRLKPSSN